MNGRCKKIFGRLSDRPRRRRPWVDRGDFGQLFLDGRCDEAVAKVFFSPKFGMLADKFGVHWMVIARQ